MKTRIKPISFNQWKKEINPANNLCKMEFINAKINGGIKSQKIFETYFMKDLFKKSLSILKK